MQYREEQELLNSLDDINTRAKFTNEKLDTLIDSFNTQTIAINNQSAAINRQATATEALVTLLTKIENNTNPDPKINAPSKRVDMNK